MENHELKLDNAKLYEKLDQMIAKVQTLETSQANPNIDVIQEYADGGPSQQTTDTTTNANNTIDTKQQVDCKQVVVKGEFDYGQEIVINQKDDEDENIDSEEMVEMGEEEDGEAAQQISDTPNNELNESRQVTKIVNSLEVQEDEHYNTRGARKRKLDRKRVDTAPAVKRQTSELMNDEDGVIRVNEGDEQSEVNEQAINAQAEAIDQSPRQSTDESQPNQLNNQNKHYITVHL